MPFDPSKPFETLDEIPQKPIARGFDPSQPFETVEEQPWYERALESTGDFIDSAREGVPIISPVIQKAGALGQAGIESIADYFGGDPMTSGAYQNKDFSDTYDQAIAGFEQRKKEREERSPIASMSGSVAGAAMLPVAGPSWSGLGGAFGRIAGETALDAADKTIRGEEMDLATTAGVMAGVESIPYIGKGLAAVGKQAKRLLPATEDAFPIVNKVTSKLGSMVPGTDVDADDLNRLLTNKEGRRDARKFKKPGAQEKLAETSTDLIREVDSYTDDVVKSRYFDAEKELFDEVGSLDVDKFDFQTVDRIKGIINERPQLFGRAGKVITNVDDILKNGGVDEIGEHSFGMKLNDLIENYGSDDAAKVQTKRLLDARRYIDDVTKNVDYERMLKAEKEMIVKARRSINDQLENLTGSENLRKMDDFYSRYVKSKKDALSKLSVPTPSGSREYTPEKTLQFFRSESAQAKFIDRKFDDLAKVMDEIDRTGSVTNVRDGLSAVRKSFGILNDIERLKRATGGPTSQGVNTAAQIFAASQTAGASLALLPITNPVAWMRIVDGADEVVRPFLNKVTDASKEILKRYPRAAVRAYQLYQNDEEKKTEPDPNAEAGLREEGVFDIFRPVKDIALNKMSDSGVPEGAQMAFDFLTPDGLPIPTGLNSSNNKKIIDYKKYKPSRYKKVPAKSRFEEYGLDSYIGNSDYHKVRAAQNAGDTPTDFDKTISGLKSFIEREKKPTDILLRRAENLTDDEIRSLLQTNEVTFSRMVSAYDENAGMPGGDILPRSNVDLWLHPGIDAADATKINPGEGEWLIPEGQKMIVGNVEKIEDISGKDRLKIDLFPESALNETENVLVKKNDDFSVWKDAIDNIINPYDQKIEDHLSIPQEKRGPDFNAEFGSLNKSKVKWRDDLYKELGVYNSQFPSVPKFPSNFEEIKKPKAVKWDVNKNSDIDPLNIYFSDNLKSSRQADDDFVIEQMIKDSEWQEKWKKEGLPEVDTSLPHRDQGIQALKIRLGDRLDKIGEDQLDEIISNKAMIGPRMLKNVENDLEDIIDDSKRYDKIKDDIFKKYLVTPINYNELIGPTEGTALSARRNLFEKLERNNVFSGIENLNDVRKSFVRHGQWKSLENALEQNTEFNQMNATTMQMFPDRIREIENVSIDLSHDPFLKVK